MAKVACDNVAKATTRANEKQAKEPWWNRESMRGNKRRCA